MESPRLPLQLFCSKVPTFGGLGEGDSVRVFLRDTDERYLLLICSGVEVEHIEQSLDIKLRKDPCGIEYGVWSLRII